MSQGFRHPGKMTSDGVQTLHAGPHALLLERGLTSPWRVQTTRCQPLPAPLGAHTGRQHCWALQKPRHFCCFVLVAWAGCTVPTGARPSCWQSVHRSEGARWHRALLGAARTDFSAGGLHTGARVRGSAWTPGLSTGHRLPATVGLDVFCLPAPDPRSVARCVLLRVLFLTCRSSVHFQLIWC